jgi:hypothetical protein
MFRLNAWLRSLTLQTACMQTINKEAPGHVLRQSAGRKANRIGLNGVIRESTMNDEETHPSSLYCNTGEAYERATR